MGPHLSAKNNCPELARDVLSASVEAALPVEVVPRTDMLRIRIGKKVRSTRRAIP